MKCQEIISVLNCEVLVTSTQQKEYSYGFATDLMSDALALVSSYNSETILLTGLANVQSIRTAEMLDISLIVYVRGKCPTVEDLQFAKDNDMVVVKTQFSMYEACGILYSKGLSPVKT